MRALNPAFQFASNDGFLISCIQTGFDGLGGIDTGTAADRNQPVTVCLHIQCRTGLGIGQIRIGVEIRKYGRRKQPGIFFHERTDQRFRSDDHWFPDTGFVRHLPKFTKAVSPPDNFLIIAHSSSSGIVIFRRRIVKKPGQAVFHPHGLR